MLGNSACNVKELAASGPLIRSALSHCEREVDFVRSWSSNNFANWGIKSLNQDVSSESGFGDSFGLDHEIWGIQKKATNPAPTLQNNKFEKTLWVGKCHFGREQKPVPCSTGIATLALEIGC